MKKEEILRLLRENRSVLERFGVKKIGLFGSATGKELSPESDIDIYVEFDLNRVTLENYLELIEFLEELFKRRIDILTKEGLRNIRVPHIKRQIKDTIVYA